MTNEQVTVYVRLLNEGVPVMRPAPAAHLGTDRYRLGQPAGYDPSDEVWEFPPGSIVRCDTKEEGGEQVLVAVSEA